MPVGDVERAGELPCGHVAGPDVAGLARLHDVVERFHGLLDRRGRVVAMNLIEVDVVDAEPP